MSKIAGRLKEFRGSWENLTSDANILQWVIGLKIPFTSKVIQNSLPPEARWSLKEEYLISSQINDLLVKGTISRCDPVRDQFISKIFLTPKPDGSYRLILNLKKLNNFLETEHFKIEDWKVVQKIVSKNCFMATLDLKDAYYLIAIAKEDRKCLRFIFNGQIYEFNCLPFGLSIAPWVFTKLMKPVMAHLREAGYLSVIYLDDILLIGNSHTSCLENVEATCSLLKSLGFIVNGKKSKLLPSKHCTYLGLDFYSESMTIQLPPEKAKKVLKIISTFSRKKISKVRDFASLIGSLGSCCQATKYGWAHMKDFERSKYNALLDNNNNYDRIMQLPASLKDDFDWWKSAIIGTKREIQNCKFTIEIFSDASRSGWGACCNNKKAFGQWKDKEKNYHINVLELLAAFFGLKCFASQYNNCNILLRIDNTTAIAYINKMGGIRFINLSKIAKTIWNWCEQRNIWLYASYIRSELNGEADFESRRLEPETEFQLADDVFQTIIQKFSRPEVDLFASRVNKKCEKYIAWTRDPDAMAIDAFTLDWKCFFFYAFPPFAIILKVLRKIMQDKATGIVVVPYWPAQPWFPLCYSLFKYPPIIFEPRVDLLRFSNREPHPFWKRITLVAGILCGKRS